MRMILRIMILDYDNDHNDNDYDNDNDNDNGGDDNCEDARGLSSLQRNPADDDLENENQCEN